MKADWRTKIKSVQLTRGKDDEDVTLRVVLEASAYTVEGLAQIALMAGGTARVSLEIDGEQGRFA